jgi:hypothetical protein
VEAGQAVWFCEHFDGGDAAATDREREDREGAPVRPPGHAAGNAVDEPTVLDYSAP